MYFYAINHILPSTISVRQVWEVPAEFHCRFDAKARSYQYFIHSFKDPFLEKRSWYFQRDLNIDRMNEACQIILNQKDFASFCETLLRLSINFQSCAGLQVPRSVPFEHTSET